MLVFFFFRRFCMSFNKKKTTFFESFCQWFCNTFHSQCNERSKESRFLGILNRMNTFLFILLLAPILTGLLFQCRWHTLSVKIEFFSRIWIKFVLNWLFFVLEKSRMWNVQDKRREGKLENKKRKEKKKKMEKTKKRKFLKFSEISKFWLWRAFH